MSRGKSSRRTVVTIYVGFPPAKGLKPAARREPAVGIWWAEASVVVAFVQPLARGEPCGGFLDSPLEHRREWGTAAPYFARARCSDYWSVARGRVLWERRKASGVIYHGNESDASCVAQIAGIYGLSKWRSAMDDHYMMGDEADRVFEL